MKIRSPYKYLYGPCPFLAAPYKYLPFLYKYLYFVCRPVCSLSYFCLFECVCVYLAVFWCQFVVLRVFSCALCPPGALVSRAAVGGDSGLESACLWVRSTRAISRAYRPCLLTKVARRRRAQIFARAVQIFAFFVQIFARANICTAGAVAFLWLRSVSECGVSEVVLALGNLFASPWPLVRVLLLARSRDGEFSLGKTLAKFF